MENPTSEVPMLRLELALNHVNLVLMALSKLTYETSVQTIELIRHQASSQLEELESSKTANCYHFQ